MQIAMKWLLIFDNVEDIQNITEFWPSSRTGAGSILITTRKINVASAARGSEQHISSLSEAEAWQLFGRLMHDAKRKGWTDLKSIASDEERAARALLTQLGGLPLGIRHIAGLITVKRNSVAHFLRRYDEEAGNTEKLFGTARKPFDFDQDYKCDLHTVWRLSFEELAKPDNEHAFRLLGAICLLSPDEIPADLFLQATNGRERCLEFCHSSYL